MQHYSCFFVYACHGFGSLAGLIYEGVEARLFLHMPKNLNAGSLEMLKVQTKCLRNVNI